MPSNNGHWGGLKADPYHYLGFIYLIEDKTTGRSYVGRKQYWVAKQVKGCKSKTTDKRHPKWRGKCWKESNWRDYQGSSPSMKKWREGNPDNEYVHTILCQCYSKSELHYKEVEELVLRGVLWKKLPDGSDHEYFNRSIPATRFRVADRTEEDSIFYGGDDTI